jgi:hypothetical protein
MGIRPFVMSNGSPPYPTGCALHIPTVMLIIFAELVQ